MNQSWFFSIGVAITHRKITTTIAMAKKCTSWTLHVITWLHHNCIYNHNILILWLDMWSDLKTSSVNLSWKKYALTAQHSFEMKKAHESFLIGKTSDQISRTEPIYQWWVMKFYSEIVISSHEMTPNAGYWFWQQMSSFMYLLVLELLMYFTFFATQITSSPLHKLVTIIYIGNLTSKLTIK